IGFDARRLRFRHLLSGEQLKSQGTGYALRNIGFQRKYTSYVVVVSFAPKGALIAHLDQLRRDTNLVPLAPHAGLKNVTYSHFPPDLFNTFGLFFFLHCESCCDSPKFWRKHPPQLIDHLVRETVTEIALLRIPIQVLEGQYRQ